MPRILALDTATDACSIALCAEGECREWFDIVPRRHSDLILPMIDEVLTKANIPLADINAIAFGCGPGSFMGARLATGVAQGLAFGIGCPVIPVSTLHGLAQTVYEATKAERILAGWDARMGAIYWGAYCLGDAGILQAVKEDALNDPGEIQLPSDEPWCAAGNAWAVYREQLPASVLKSFNLEKTDCYPRASGIATIALQKYHRGETLPAEQAEPLYLRDKVTS